METKDPSRLSQDASAPQGCPEAPVTAWFERIAHCHLLKYLFQSLRKVFSWVHSVVPAGTPGGQSHPAQSPDRPVRHARKRLGTLSHVLLAFIPCRVQQALGYLPIIERKAVSEETLKMPIYPSGKGNKRKQDDIALEDHLCWVETLQKELSDEDDPDDPIYEPAKSDTDSEEYKSQNSTEVDLEVEEKDGILMLKEDLSQQEGLSRGGEASPGASGKEAPSFRSSGDGSEQPGQEALSTSGDPSVTPETPVVEAGRSLQSQDPVERHMQEAAVASSSDSQDQWVDVSGE
ncbi:uncharacterized protein LOC133372428 [Rhineura floridana]|uniref:uncharacterized protein LOC133372428 n=1 Tax=Rhineura floridana TaxID=261503 RepID=UPI002AC7EAA0|nr:uncharacterized protein LOC133372428 [Rhineura floridana]